MTYSELDTLMGAYFHQDFDETGGVWGTLDLYLSEADRSRITGLIDEIDRTLATMSEAQVEEMLSGLGCAVHWEGPEAYRAWLGQIRQAAQDRLLPAVR